MASELPPVILLAAGKSSRMGKPKGLVEWEGRPWLEHQLHTLERLGIDQIYVALGFHEIEYRTRIPALTSPPKNLIPVTNPDPERGPFSSLQEILLRAPLPEGAFLLPLDVPSADHEVWLALARAGKQTGADAVLPRYEDRRGHPVWLSANFLDWLRTIPTDSPAARLDVQIRALPSSAIVEVAVKDRRVTLNLNTPEDFAKLQPKGIHESTHDSRQERDDHHARPTKPGPG